MNIGALTITEYATFHPHDPIAIAKETLVKDRFAVVTEDGSYVGLLTMADVIQRPHILVGDCLGEMQGLKSSCSVEECLSFMEERSAHFIPVFDDERFEGVVSYKSLVDKLEEQRRLLDKHLYKIEQFDSMRILAAGVGHDFNNVLTRIMGHIKLAQLDMPECPGATKNLDEASDCAVKASELAKQLMIFARDERIERTKVDPRSFIEENAAFMVRGQRIALSCELPDDLDPVCVSKEQFSRVIGNLILNAIQAMGERPGKMTIRGRNTLVEDGASLELRSGRYVELEFEDDGPGIPEEILPRLFEPYFTTKSSGSGLGLAIVYSIVSGHGGTVDVVSKGGAGTTFRMLLPSCEEDSIPD